MRSPRSWPTAASSRSSFRSTWRGTPLENTKLIVNIVPGMAECEDCDEIFNVIECNGYCPNCNSFNKTVLSGKDFTIREIHVPEERKPGSVET